jgi:2-oxoglutarate ferredoxin oxidoreductase subunit alpha
MTATSRRDLPYAMRKMGLGALTRSPCVLVNIKTVETDVGPTGPDVKEEMTQPESALRSGYEPIAYAPNSVQEMFDLTVKAFKMAEKYQTPTFVLADQDIANMVGKLVIPTSENIEIGMRRKRAAQNPHFTVLDFMKDLPPIATVHKGQQVRVSGGTSEEPGYLFTSYITSELMIQELTKNVHDHIDEITEVEPYLTQDANVVIVAYGSPSISALHVVEEARKREKKVGLLRLITPSPFPSKQIERLNAEKIIVHDDLSGQVERLVRESASCSVVGIHHETGASASQAKIYEALSRE